MRLQVDFKLSKSPHFKTEYISLCHPIESYMIEIIYAKPPSKIQNFTIRQLLNFLPGRNPLVIAISVILLHLEQQCRNDVIEGKTKDIFKDFLQQFLVSHE